MDTQYMLVLSILLLLNKFCSGAEDNPEDYNKDLSTSAFFNEFHGVSDGELDLASFESGLNDLALFKFCPSSKKNKMIEQFKRGLNGESSMDVNKFCQTFSISEVLTDILPRGKDKYDQPTLCAVFEISQFLAERLLNGKSSVGVSELLSNASQ